MKLTKLSHTAKRELKHTRDILAEACENFHSANSALAALDAQHQSLTSKIVRLEESIHPTDSKGIEELSKLKTQREFVAGKMEAHSGRGTPFGEELHIALNQVSQTIRTALKPEYEHFRTEIASKLRPYYRAWGWEIAAAEATDAFKEFALFISYRFDSYGPNVIEARKAIARIDLILKGELDWQFNPNAR
jgi:uncharacterized protein YdcH (DUF465 family)